MNPRLLVVLCCLSASAAAWGESGRELYALNCMGCHPIGSDDKAFRSEPSYTAEFRQGIKKRSFFIRVPQGNQPPLSKVKDAELVAEILSWAKACPQLPEGVVFNGTRRDAGEVRAVTLGPAPAPTPASPPVNESLAELGRYLFFDTRLSSDWSRSCARCHDPARGWGDGAALSKGYTNTDYFRNSPSLLNVAQRRRLMWDGSLDGRDLANAVRSMISRPDMMHADPRLVIERIKLVPEYVALWRKAFGPDAEVSAPRMDSALAEFLKTIASRDVPFDRYLGGDRGALDAAAREGLRLFRGKAGCSRCHSGPSLSDNEFHRLGVPENPQVWADSLRAVSLLRYNAAHKVPDPMQVREDLGRYVISKNEADRRRFLTPPLRGLKYTAPYMHNGVFRTLDEVVEFYDRGGGKSSELAPLHLTSQERRALVAFLESLSGDPVEVKQPLQPRMQPREFATKLIADESTATAFVDGVSATPHASVPPLGPLPVVPVPADNPITAAKVELGKMLFWDPRMSGDGSTPCVSCHFPQAGWGDGEEISRGYPGNENLRNAQTLLDAAYYARPFWEGSVDSLEAQARTAGTGVVEGNADPLLVEMRLRFIPEYVQRFRAVFGTEWPRIGDAWRAIATFVRTVVTDPRKVPFDRYLRGDHAALSPAALRGYALFDGKAGCIQCHNGPLASDQKYHSVGLPENNILRSSVLHQVTHSFAQRAKGLTDPRYLAADMDMGRYYQTRHFADIGKFRTPGLRELKYTAPYMHNGAFRTLDEVVQFFNQGGGAGPNKSRLLKPLGLNAGEKRDLVEFLRSLSMDEPLLVAMPRLPPLGSISQAAAAVAPRR